MKIHVLLKKEELDAQRLPGKTMIVLDILFATSSIVAALAHGAAEVIPTLDGAGLRQALFELEPRLHDLVAHLSDEEIRALPKEAGE